MQSRKLLLMFGLLLSFPVFASKYLCIPDKATGFALNEETDSWEIQKFNMDDKKFLVSLSSSPQFSYQVTKAGSSKPFVNCDKGFRKNETLRCINIAYDFKFSSATTRFLLISRRGYWMEDEQEESPTEPYMAIGTCSLL